MNRANPTNMGYPVIGMEGVALLRTWLTGNRREIWTRVHELTKFVTHPHEGPLSIELDIPERDYLEGYAAWAETYDSALNPLICLEEPTVQRLIDHLPAGTALDAACGTGRHTAYLASHNHQVVGVDGSREMLEKARIKFPTVEFQTGDLFHLPVESGSVDSAVCALALTHCEDLIPPLHELARVVRPGGRVILSDQHPTMTLLGGQALFAAKDGSFAYVPSYFHSHSSYFEAFEAAGLTVRRCLEPAYGPKEIAILLNAVGLKGIADEAFGVALQGVPGVLVWELRRNK